MSIIRKPKYRYHVHLQLKEGADLVEVTAEGLGISDRDHSHLFVFDSSGTLSHAFQRQKVVYYEREFLEEVDVEIPEQSNLTVPGYSPNPGIN